MSDNTGFNLSQGSTEGLDESVLGMGTGNNGLPVPAPLFYVTNGNGVPNEATALQFGGWQADVEGMQRVLSATGNKLPSGLQQSSMYSRSGNLINAYTTRRLFFSPVAVRTSWIDKDNGIRSPKFFEGARRHTQVAVVLATSEQAGTLQVWGPAVLSAKGFQAKNLIDAINKWQSNLLDALNSNKINVTPSAFWCSVGTFGDYRPEQVGSGRAKSSITPVVVNPVELNEKNLRMLFGGDALIAAIKEMQKYAPQWRDMWATASNDVPTQHDQPHQQQLPNTPPAANGNTNSTGGTGDLMPW